MLPKIPLPTDTVKIGDTEITVRGLSRAEAMQMSTRFTPETADEAEAFVVSCGASVTLDEAREWLNTTDAAHAGIVVEKIIEITGLNTTDPKGITNGTS